jgi:para-nitrobenzyl esterase
VLDPADGPEYAGMTAEQRALADQIVLYWSTFARTGDPNGPGLPRRTRFEGGAADV